MIRKLFTFLMCAVFGLIMVGATNAATVLTPDGDTYIRSSNPTTNYNSGPAYMVANDRGSDVRMAVFSFDLSSLPAGSITEAKLELDDVVGNANQTYEIWGLLDAHEDFDESTLTWNTAGFVDGSDITTVDSAKAYGGAMLGTFVNTANSVNTAFDVTSGNFLDFLNAGGDDDVTFVIVDPNSGIPGTGWATKEAGSGDLKPTLTLTTAAPAVPVPGSLSASLLALAGLLIARRRSD